MKRTALALACMASMLIAQPAVAASRGVSVSRTLHAFHTRIGGKIVRTETEGAAPVHQAVQSGAITNAEQLRESGAMYGSGFSVEGQAFTPSDLDDPTITDQAFLHYEINQSTGVHFSYKESGALFGFAERATQKFPSGNVFILEYVATAYSNPDGAQSAFNSLASYYATLSQYISGMVSTTCTFSGATQCLEVTIPGAFTDNTTTSTPYNAVVRILLKSNSVWEGAYFLPAADYAANRTVGEQDLDVMAQGYINLFNAPATTPTPTPTQPPVHPTTTPTSTPIIPPIHPPTLTKTPIPSTPTPTPVQFSLVKVQFEKATSSPKPTDKQLKKAKPGTKVILVVFYNVDSGPPNFPYTAAWTIKRGGKVLGHNVDQATLDANDPTGGYSYRVSLKLPKQTGTYKGTWTITMNGVTRTGSASIQDAAH